ncbi:hypothetical protein ACFL1V_07180 [Pseudomonadota bacterium]
MINAQKVFHTGEAILLKVATATKRPGATNTIDSFRLILAAAVYIA